jgi:hypothetical protein
MSSKRRFRRSLVTVVLATVAACSSSTEVAMNFLDASLDLDASRPDVGGGSHDATAGQDSATGDGSAKNDATGTDGAPQGDANADGAVGDGGANDADAADVGCTPLCTCNGGLACPDVTCSDGGCTALVGGGSFECAADASCVMTYQYSGGVDVHCGVNSTCTLSIGGSGGSDTICAAGATCNVDLEGSGTHDVDCRDAKRCNISGYTGICNAIKCGHQCKLTATDCSVLCVPPSLPDGGIPDANVPDVKVICDGGVIACDGVCN